MDMKKREITSTKIKEQISIFYLYWGIFAILYKIASAFEYGGSNILHESSVFEIVFFAICFYFTTIICIDIEKTIQKKATSSRSSESSDKQS